jgi:hypothetical protein
MKKSQAAFELWWSHIAETVKDPDIEMLEALAKSSFISGWEIRGSSDELCDRIKEKNMEP